AFTRVLNMAYHGPMLSYEGDFHMAAGIVITAVLHGVQKNFLESEDHALPIGFRKFDVLAPRRNCTRRSAVSRSQRAVKLIPSLVAERTSIPSSQAGEAIAERTISTSAERSNGLEK